ncbi:hypothetical protein ACU686_26345 [Yinghuangia aomiensis]
MGLATTGPTVADFRNQGFVRQYAITFAGATFLTLLLWLSAVIKRAVRGVPFFTAIGEAVGYLWLTVMASAFTPLVLYQPGDRRRRHNAGAHERRRRRVHAVSGELPSGCQLAWWRAPSW